MAISHCYCESSYWQIKLICTIKNGDFTFLLLELILADQVADPPSSLSSGQEWQFHIDFHKEEGKSQENH